MSIQSFIFDSFDRQIKGLLYTTLGKCEHTALFLRLAVPFTLIRVDGASDKEISKMVLEKLCWHFSLRK